MTGTLRIVTLSSLFPNEARPGAGLFVRERMFRVGAHVPLAVVSPQPWFPFQQVVRWLRPGYRPAPAHRLERQGEFDVYLPRFLAVPGVLRRFDGFLMALACLPLFRHLKRTSHVTLIDAHFAYPDGYAASLLARWLDLPFVVTLRGTEPGHLNRPALRKRVVDALSRAVRVLAVSESLCRVARAAGVLPDKCRVVGNGVDLRRFHPLPRAEARAALGIPAHAKVLISVGGLVERKGFHRVIDAMPELLRRHEGLHYLVVGGPSPEGDLTQALHAQVRALRLVDRVTFLGHVPPDELLRPLSAADVFVLATRNEGWANVFLEAMAVGLPVVTTDVGGNREVVSSDQLGLVVPFGDQEALSAAIARALDRDWDREAIMAHAARHTWERRIDALLVELRSAIAADAQAVEAAVDA